MTTEEGRTFEQICEAIWSVHRQVGVVRDAIAKEKHKFNKPERTLLEIAEKHLHTTHLNVEPHIQKVIDGCKLADCCQHPFGTEGC